MREWHYGLKVQFYDSVVEALQPHQAAVWTTSAWLVDPIPDSDEVRIVTTAVAQSLNKRDAASRASRGIHIAKSRFDMADAATAVERKEGAQHDEVRARESHAQAVALLGMLLALQLISSLSTWAFRAPRDEEMESDWRVALATLVLGCGCLLARVAQERAGFSVGKWGGETPARSLARAAAALSGLVVGVRLLLAGPAIWNSLGCSSWPEVARRWSRVGAQTARNVFDRWQRGRSANREVAPVALELSRLADLLERGHITQDEFDAEKRKLFGVDARGGPSPSSE